MGLSPEDKKRFLKALEEDWEFRNAVMGLLGIQELLKGMAELRSTQVEVLKVLTELLNAQRELVDRVGKLEAGFNELRDRVGRLEDRMDGFEKRIDSLEGRMDKLERRMDSLEGRMSKLEEGFNELKERVDKLDRTMERITAALEDEANDVVTYYLRQRGINIETSRIHLDSVYEFDIYGTNGQLTIIGEAKTRLSKKMVEEVVARVRNAMSAFPDKFPGKVIIVIYSVRVDPETVEEARRQGVWLFESLREKTPFPA